MAGKCCCVLSTIRPVGMSPPGHWRQQGRGRAAPSGRERSDAARPLWDLPGTGCRTALTGSAIFRLDEGANKRDIAAQGRNVPDCHQSGRIPMTSIGPADRYRQRRRAVSPPSPFRASAPQTGIGPLRSELAAPATANTAAVTMTFFRAGYSSYVCLSPRGSKPDSPPRSDASFARL